MKPDRYKSANIFALSRVVSFPFGLIPLPQGVKPFGGAPSLTLRCNTASWKWLPPITDNNPRIVISCRVCPFIRHTRFQQVCKPHCFYLLLEFLKCKTSDFICSSRSLIVTFITAHAALSSELSASTTLWFKTKQKGQQNKTKNTLNLLIYFYHQNLFYFYAEGPLSPHTPSRYLHTWGFG